MNKLLADLEAAGLVVDGYIILDALQRCSVADFFEMFGSTDGTYGALVAANANGDGTFKGYTRFFDSWKDAGLIV